MQSITQKMQPVIVIPAYQPTESLITLIHEINGYGSAQTIIVVDDGSKGPAKEVFAKLIQFKNVVLLEHAVNLGKGQALKTAFNYYLLNHSTDSVGVVTADADGQHTAKDIQNVAEKLMQSPQIMWLGSRALDRKVPLRSRFGNSLTRRIFQLIMGKSVYDTQTGLRGIPSHALPDLLRIPSCRYEFELDMLMRIIRKKIEIREVPIETIYIDGNKSSHFNPILDSLKVYFVFLRYVAASLSSSLLDFVCFVIFHLLSHQVFFSLATARVISGSFNFMLCKKMIFKSGKNPVFEALKYLALAVFSLTLSYILVTGLVKEYGFNLYVSKIVADICVFLVNFTIQKVFVFPVNAVRE